MKKLITFLISLTLILCLLIGCGQADKPTANADNESAQTTEISIQIPETIPTLPETTKEETTEMETSEETTEILTESQISSEESTTEIETPVIESDEEVYEEPIPQEDPEPISEESEEEYYEEPESEEDSETFPYWDGEVSTAYKGVNWGPTGKETYYNLDMSGIISAVQRGGWLYNDCINKDLIDEILDTSGYWIREDGCKMFGPYIIVAANLNHFPRGSIVECSLGTAIVLDTGGFASSADGWNWLDIATNW